MEQPEKSYFFVKANKAIGPLKLNELFENKIGRNTFIWTYGMDKWERLKSITTLHNQWLDYQYEKQKQPSTHVIFWKKKYLIPLFLFLIISISFFLLQFNITDFSEKSNSNSISHGYNNVSSNFKSFISDKTY